MAKRSKFTKEDTVMANTHMAMCSIKLHNKNFKLLHIVIPIPKIGKRRTLTILNIDNFVE